MITIDGNEAAAYIAHRTNEVIAIYPITPASPMGELCDKWSSMQQCNLWGVVPEIIEMQSEGGAAGAIHGALQAGALTTTFTASQGLLLMIPNMYKIAGELTSLVIHVAARSIAAQALSIFGDHSDVMATRATGFAMLASNSVQEAMDMALIAQASTLEARIPIIHFFDGFRTSHEINKVTLIDDDIINTLIHDDLIHAHRRRALSPDHPVIRGTSQNPDVFFQARETVNPFYQKMPNIVQKVMNEFSQLTGRSYQLFQYAGAEDAEHVIAIIGSGAEAVQETVEHLTKRNEKVGVVKVRLYRPFSCEHLIEALPSTVKTIAVLDRTKEPGANGEPLYKDVQTALVDYISTGGNKFSNFPRVIGGRYGLASKEFNPSMIKSVFDEMKNSQPKNNFTVGIIDDVTNSSLKWDPNYCIDAIEPVTSALFYGLGSDGTVSANKNTIKIIGEQTSLYAQGYFVYDSKKAGAITVSHLRFSNQPIHSTYLIGNNEANFIGCHQAGLIERYPILDKAATGSTFLLNSPSPANEIWNKLPAAIQKIIIKKNIKFYSIDAYKIADQAGLAQRINTIMQTCFFAITDILPKNQAIDKIKKSVKLAYSAKGERILKQNFTAIDATLTNLYQVDIPSSVTSNIEQWRPASDGASNFIQKVTAEMIAGRGDMVPVSLLPSDGTYPLGTTQYEKRRLARDIPVWEPELCIQCGKCVFVCPHTAIRSKVIDIESVNSTHTSLKHIPITGKEFDEKLHITYQVAPEDCTGCGLCVDVCPARDKKIIKRKALNLAPLMPLLESERENFSIFLKLPEFDRQKIHWSNMKNAMLAQPLFEFSSACAGCGETPYIRLVTQLFGDRAVIANATGCSSIYGGNLPSTPYTTNNEGRGPAWSNSLFEDNAEFGLGIRIAIDKQYEFARTLLEPLSTQIGEPLVTMLLNADQSDETGIQEQRQHVSELKNILSKINTKETHCLENIADTLVKKSVWIIGGDGWAYDIGFGGLDHVLASGKNVNILVLDTEVYSNTGGQSSKATPRGAVAKFASAGKSVAKKDFSLIAMAYEHVYVAHVAFGAKDVQTLKAIREAESYIGPSLIIAYSPCIAHGINLSNNLHQQHLAERSGHWPLFRFDPRLIDQQKNPLQLDSKMPDISFREFAETEMRFNILLKTKKERADQLFERAQEDIDERYKHYEQLAEIKY